MPTLVGLVQVSDIDAEISYPGSSPRFSMTESEEPGPSQRLVDKNNKNVYPCITNTQNEKSLCNKEY
jgi:hypothetical protein